MVVKPVKPIKSWLFFIYLEADLRVSWISDRRSVRDLRRVKEVVNAAKKHHSTQ